MQTALGGHWRESHEKRVSLPKVKVCDFEVYLEWLYTGHVVTLDESESRGIAFVQLYLLGDFLDDDRFCNAVIDMLIDKSRHGGPEPITFWPQGLNRVWSETFPGSMLRRVLVDFIILERGGLSRTVKFICKNDWSKDLMAGVLTRIGEHKEVAGALLMIIRDKIQEAIKSAVQHPGDQDKCNYHKHGEGYPRCS